MIARRVAGAATWMLFALGAGCSVGPRYTRPPMSLPREWRVPADTGTTLADYAWWKVFGDTALQMLIRSALAQNQDLGQAAARVREARAQYVVARSALFPKLDATAIRLDARVLPLFGGTPTGPVPTTRFYSPALRLTYDVDLFGYATQTARAARADWDANANDRRAVMIGVISTVAQAYFNLLRLDRIARVTERTVQSRRTSLELVRRRFEDGVAAELDVRRAEQELAAAAAELPDVRRQVTETENQLSYLLGRNPGPILRGAMLDSETVPPIVPAGLPATLLTRRPDIREAESRLIASNARARAALSRLLPTLSLTGFYGSQSSSLSELLDSRSRLWLVFTMATAPLFHGGELRGNLQAARAREQESSIAYQQALLRALREVNDALAYRRSANEARTERQAQVTAAQRALDLANMRYTEGVGTYLDVLDAERQLFAAELDLATVTADQLNAVVQLYYALGGGWDAGAAGQAGRDVR